MLLSVIMPVYNSERYLKESIESILKQTYKVFEFIIINDGSTDASLDIIKDYAKQDKRIIIISRDNRGLVNSLNEGIAKAKGKYIARMDADDISFENRLQIQVEYMETNEEIDILGSKVEVIGEVYSNDKNDIEKRYGRLLDENKNLLEVFLRENSICHPSVIMKKSFIDKIGGYRPEYYCAEDYDLWIRGIRQGFTIRNIEQKLLKYRIHKNSKVRTENKMYGTIKDMINIRLDSVNLKNSKTYMIWGASTGGKLTKDIISTRFKHMKFNGFIDGLKKGTFEGHDIISADELEKNDVDYIFIATKPGKEYAEEILNEKGLKPLKDYLWTI